MPVTVKRILFHPLLVSEEDVIIHIRSEPPGTAHIFNRVLYVWDGRDVQRLDYRDKKDDFFLDNTSLNQLGDVLGQRMLAHEAALTDIMSYDVITPTDLTFDIPLKSGKMFCFALSLHNSPSYHDLFISNAKAEILCYGAVNNSKISGITHSGDMIGAKNVLLHTLSATMNMTTDPLVLGVSGYTNQPLKKYKAQNPAILLADHDAKVLYLVPCPLDEATIGNATLCLPVVLKRVGARIRVTLLTNPPTQEKLFVSNSKLSSATDTIRAAIQTAEALARSLPTAVRPATDKADPKSKESSSAPAVSAETGVAQRAGRASVVIAEAGLAPPVVEHAKLVWFGLGLSTEQPAEKDIPAIIPCCIGNVLEGGKVLALGTPFRGDIDAFRAAMGAVRSGSVPVVVVSDRMTDQCRVLNPNMRLNGLFIIQPGRTYPYAVFDDPAARNRLLTELNVNAVTALAGPQSFVVVQLGGNYFFYRGVTWPDVFPVVPTFGHDVTEDVQRVLVDPTLLRDATFVWSSISDLRTEGNRVFLGKQVVGVEKISEIFALMDLPNVLQLKVQITDVLTQLQTILTAENVNRVSGLLITILKAKISAAIESYKEAYVKQVLKCVSGNMSHAEKEAAEKEKAAAHTVYKGAEREAKEATQWLIDALGNLVSTRTSSSKGHDLNQIAKKAVVANHVQEAKNMDAEAVAKIVSENCTRLGVIVGNIDAGTLRIALEAVSENRFLTAVASPPLSETRLLTASAVRSSTELSALLPVVKTIHRGPLAGSAHAFTFALPQLAPESDVTRSSVPWPCFDHHIALKDPSDVFWPDQALISDVAKLRILARGTFAEASKAPGMKAVIPASRDLGFFLVFSVLDLMTDLAQSLRSDAKRIALFPDANTVSDSDDFHSPAAQAFRGMFGQLFSLMASGTGKPLCMAWQLVMKNPKLDIPDHSEITIYSRVAGLLPHTRWPLDNLQRNAKLFLVRALRQRVIDPVTAPIRKAVVAMEKQRDRQHLDNKNTELAFLQLAIEVVRNIKEGGVPDDQARAVAARLLARVPDDARNDGGMGIVRAYFKRLALSGKVPDTMQLQTVQACANMFMKRSGHFKRAKKAASKAVKEEKEQRVAEVAGMMSAEKANIEQQWGTGELKLQNFRPYVAALAASGAVSTEEAARIAGDAEKVRIPWRVLTGEEAPKSEIAKEVAEILGQDVPASVTEGQLVAQDDIAGTIKSQSLDARLRALAHGDKAADLLRDLQRTDLEGFCSAMQLPKQAVRTFLACVGYLDDTLARDFFLRVSEELLNGWRDPIVAERTAMCLT